MQYSKDSTCNCSKYIFSSNFNLFDSNLVIKIRLELFGTKINDTKDQDYEMQLFNLFHLQFTPIA